MEPSALTSLEAVWQPLCIRFGSITIENAVVRTSYLILQSSTPSTRYLWLLGDLRLEVADGGAVK